MTRSQATPASSQIITLTRMLEEREGEIERLCVERDRFMDEMLTLGTELRAIEAALDDERINLTHTAAQVAAEMRDKINELHAQIERLRAQTAPSVPDGWQPIETAPKDGTHVLLANKTGTRVADGMHGNYKVWSWPYVMVEPAYWRPIPAAPGAQENSNA